MIRVLFRPAAVVLVILVSWVALVGCRTRLLSTADSVPVDGAAALDANTPAPDLAGRAPGGSVNCGPNNTCSIADGEHCCDTQPLVCQTAACRNTNQFDCDGPEDCGGSPCCMPVRNAPGHATCAIRCDRDSTLCHISADCPSGSVCCLNFVLGPANGLCLGACD